MRIFLAASALVCRDNWYRFYQQNYIPNVTDMYLSFHFIYFDRQTYKRTQTKSTTQANHKAKHAKT